MGATSRRNVTGSAASETATLASRGSMRIFIFLLIHGWHWESYQRGVDIPSNAVRGHASANHRVVKRGERILGGRHRERPCFPVFWIDRHLNHAQVVEV